jgi:hypothetical protein
MKIRVALAFALLSTLPARAGLIQLSQSISSPPGEHAFYEAAHRIVRLSDGSDLLLYRPDPPDERPPSMQAFLVSARGRGDDRNFRLEQWLPDEIAPGSRGQIHSGSLSPDHRWLAFSVGWLSVRDHRGHSGILVLERREGAGNWKLKSWFESPAVSVGDVEFGSDDLLLVLAQRWSPEGRATSILAVYSFAGQELAFLNTPNTHGDRPPSSTYDSRIVRVNDRTAAVYDLGASLVRYVKMNGDSRHPLLKETRAVPIPFATDRVNLVGFDPRPDGRVIFARSVIVEGSKGKTIMTVVDPDGSIAEEWESPKYWAYGYAANGVLHGYSHAFRQPMQISTVTVAASR